MALKSCKFTHPTLKAAAAGADLKGSKNPVLVPLRIGDDSVTVHADINQTDIAAAYLGTRLTRVPSLCVLSLMAIGSGVIW